MASGLAGSTTTISTAEQLASFAETAGRGRCELVQGQLVMMSPAGFEHGEVAQRIAALLHAFVSHRGLGSVVAAETGFVLSRSPDTVRAPDVGFVRADRLPRGRIIGYFEGSPDLAVEVLSPADTRDETGRGRAAAKIRDWLAAGTREVWAVDPSAKTVTIHRPATAISVVLEGGTLESLVLPGFSAGIAEFFHAPGRSY